MWRWLLIAASAMAIAVLIRVTIIRWRNQQREVRMLTPIHSAVAWALMIVYIAMTLFSRLGEDFSWRLPLATVAIVWTIYSLQVLTRFLNISRQD